MKILRLKNTKNKLIQNSREERSNKNRMRVEDITRIGQESKQVLTYVDKTQQLNEYQSQFKTKQLIKQYYGNLTERQLMKLLDRKRKSKLPILCEIEKRLDVIVFRLGFAKSIYEARYFIKTGKILTNDKIIRNPNHRVEVGSKIEIIDLLGFINKLQHIQENLYRMPTHLKLLHFNNNKYKYKKTNRKLEGLIIKEPNEADIILPYNTEVEKLNHYINKIK